MARPKPFYPYVGGKRRMLSFIDENTPDTYGDYYEPFLGGGAVAIEQLQRSPDATFHLSDLNGELIRAWQAVQSNLDSLIELLTEHSARHSPPYYLSIRNWDRNGTLSYRSDLERGARFIYICHAAFGAMWSENSQGFVQSSFGRDYFPVDVSNLRNVHALVNDRNVVIREQSFDAILEHVHAGDFAYLDPPYAVDTDDTSREGFNSYQSGGEGNDFQKRVKRVMNSLTAKGVYVLMSNASTNTTRDLFDGWNKIEKRLMWTLAGGAAAHEATEVLFGNYHLMNVLAADSSLKAE